MTPTGRDRTEAAILTALLTAVALVGVALVAIGAMGWLGPPSPPPVDDTTTPVASAAPAPIREEPTVAARADAQRSGPDAAVSSISALPDPTWLRDTATRTGIPERALAAYAGAALATARTNPGCHLGWNTLAAIGEVESAHGSLDGASLGPDGRVTPRIVGVRLDGGDTLAVPDSDRGAIDGDASWDRAVGPMQFLPSMWVRMQRDGDGDGRADIDQIDDAALTAAVMLCTTGGDLRSPERWIAAIRDYNPSVEYNHRVSAAAERFAANPAH